MAVARPYTLLILVLSLVLLITVSSVVEAKGHKDHKYKHHGHHNGHGKGGDLKPEECEPKCSYRCSATSHRKPCMFFCKKCCATCLCVPPGTSGHKEVCPCYNNWKTKEGKPKCP